jgi:ABC-type Fe3+-hydroxamate transport system substrate-binding protein
MLGRQHTLAEPAGRVAALSAAECEFLFALGRAKAWWAARVLRLSGGSAGGAVLGSGGNTNIEEILALKPDIVL